MKLNYDDLNWSMPGVKQQRVQNGITGSWVVCVMEGEVVKNLLIDSSFADTLLSALSFEEVVTTDGSFCVKITTKDNTKIELTCDEMLQAILLSEPTLVKINPDLHKHYQLITTGWKYINEDFVIPGEME